jgi:hypothetical protein
MLDFCLEKRASNSANGLSFLKLGLLSLSLSKCTNNPRMGAPSYPNRLNGGKVKSHLIQRLRLDEMNGGD